MDAFDVSTDDPFCDTKDWTSLKVIQSLNTAYNNLDDYVNNLYVGVERINQTQLKSLFKILITSQVNYKNYLTLLKISDYL